MEALPPKKATESDLRAVEVKTHFLEKDINDLQKKVSQLEAKKEEHTLELIGIVNSIQDSNQRSLIASRDVADMKQARLDDAVAAEKAEGTRRLVSTLISVASIVIALIALIKGK